MVWIARNESYIASPNYAAYTSPNYAAYSAPNYAAYSSPNYPAQGSHNYAAYSAPNYPAQGSHNYAAYSAPNYPAQGSHNYAAYPMMMGAPALRPPATGAGGASGAGFAGGYGPVARSDYATPAALGPLPWALDFQVGNGWPSLPVAQRLDPYSFNPPLQWQVGEWDPGLRFWTLPFDTQLTEWLQDLNLGSPAIMAAREYAAQHTQWCASQPTGGSSDLHERWKNDDPKLFAWRVSAETAASAAPADIALVDSARQYINAELTELVDVMRDDRMRYLAEADVQSSSAGAYFIHLLAIDPTSKPWTLELMNCASAIANMTKMHYKAHYRRVRPSTLCPALTPPWGPPQHPAFPSGHSLVAHLTALFLLSVPGIAQRFGIFDKDLSVGRAPRASDFLGGKAPRYGSDQKSPLLWMAWRVAKNRERLGLHYPSDSAASRKLAAELWVACLGNGTAAASTINVPTLRSVIEKAKAEWPEAPPTDKVRQQLLDACGSKAPAAAGRKAAAAKADRSKASKGR